MTSRRALVLGGAAALVASPAGPAGCAGTEQRFRQAFTPGQLQQGARVHAYTAAAFAHGAYDGHMVQWELRLEQVADDVPGFFDALAQSRHRAELEIVAHPPSKGGASYEHYGTTLHLLPPGKAERVSLVGEQGMGTGPYVKALVPAARQTGIPPEVIRRGHFAFFKLATMTAQLNAMDDALRKHAFHLLVVKEKLARKEPNADPLAPLRPPEDSLADVALALRIIAEHHADTGKLRAEVLATIALARNHDVPEARRALAEQMEESRARASAWRKEHRRPTPDDFGVAMRPMTLPTPENMLAVLDKDGYIAAAVKVAQSVATGDVAGTVEGFGKLAPPDSSIRIATEGVAAALRGDVVGTARAALALAEKQEDIAPVVARLRSVEQAVDAVRSAARDASGAVDKAKKDINSVRKGGKPR